MRYHLVLQFHGEMLADYDAMIAIENELIRALTKEEVSGHDAGVGELNIFILTDDPRKTFNQLSPILEGRRCLDAVTVAYRDAEGDEYTVLWPQGWSGSFTVA